MAAGQTVTVTGDDSVDNEERQDVSSHNIAEIPPLNTADYFSMLGVPRSASASQIRQAYKDQALRYHPDKNPECAEDATAAFKLVAEAYSVLGDARLRAEYECTGKPPADVRHSPSRSAQEARNMFREVFGDGFVSELRQMVHESCEEIGNMMRARLNATHSTLASIVHLSALTEAQRAAAEANAEVEQCLHQEPYKTRLFDSCLEQLAECTEAWNMEMMALVQCIRGWRSHAFLRTSAAMSNTCIIIWAFPYVVSYGRPTSLWMLFAMTVVQLSFLCSTAEALTMWLHFYWESLQCAAQCERQVATARRKAFMADRSCKAARRRLAKARAVAEAATKEVARLGSRVS